MLVSYWIIYPPSFSTFHPFKGVCQRFFNRSWLNVSTSKKNDSEEYEWEPEEILEQPEQIEYGQGKQRAIVNTQYQKDFWRH